MTDRLDVRSFPIPPGRSRGWPSSLAGVFLLAGGCIWSPKSRTEHEKGTTLVVSGYIPTAGGSVKVKARNYDTGAEVLLQTVNASATEAYPGAGMYPWSATLTNSVALAKYWAPTILGPLSASSNGRLEISAYLADDTQLVTFTEAAGECASAEIAGGADMIDAGQQCADGTELVLFDNTGIASGPEPATWVEVTGSDEGATRWDLVTYQSQGIDVYAVVCRPEAPGSYPVHVFNHGGVTGLSDADYAACRDWAEAGWVMAMSAYRGEPPPPRLGTYAVDGNVEFCLGEVTDVLRLMEVLDVEVLEADMDRVVMSGISHGGCITMRAVERGAKVRAAVDSFGPSDWSVFYNQCDEPGCEVWRAALETATGDDPAARPLAYRWRSPRWRDGNSALFAGDLAARRPDVKILIQHGREDWFVTPYHSCKLALDAWEGDSQRGHVGANGNMSQFIVAGCTESWTLGARPITWPKERYLMVYDGVSHALTGHMRADFRTFVASLGWGQAPL